MVKYLGTHNSGTSSKLIWWQKMFGPILHLTSRCQTLSIEEQLKNNVRFFNIQVTYYKGRWVFSHGLCIYTLTLDEALQLMEKYATSECPVYYQLRLDNNFFLKPKIKEFQKLVNKLLTKRTNVKMRTAFIENANIYVYNNTKDDINIAEHYWSAGWANANAKSWLDKLPLPRRHAKKFNKKYIEENKADYLMLDFIEIK